jgi:hypothetical protein
MFLIPGILFSSLPFFVEVALAAAVIGCALKLLFRFSRIPNYATASPAAFYQWWRLAPPDIVFRLAALAALNLVLYWMPVYYWTTYEPSGDERDGGLLFPSMLFCPLSWVLAGLCYVQVWRPWHGVFPRYRVAFQIVSAILLVAALSTVIPQLQFYLRMSRFSL